MKRRLWEHVAHTGCGFHARALVSADGRFGWHVGGRSPRGGDRVASA